MKNIQIKLIALLFIVFTFPILGASQDSLTNEFGYEVKRVYSKITITKEKLNEAHTLTDLNNENKDLDMYYKSSWVKEYISVEILTSHKGTTRKASAKNGTLSQEQKDIMKMADAGTDISVKVQYIPENKLTHNDIKELDFVITVDPENGAEYIGGQQKLNQYIKENAIDKIPEGSFKNYDLTAIKFAINEEGQITDAHIFESVYQSFNDEKVDKLLLETIRNMPCWTPAEYANGIKIKQEFVLTVGNMESCVINLLDVRRDKLTEND